MDTTWLSSWLTELNLPEYIVTFEDAGYTTPEQCATIRDREELKSIGVTKLGHLNRLYRAVEKLGSELNGDGVAEVPAVSATLPREFNSVHHGSELQLSEKSHTIQQSKSASLSSLSREGMATCSALTGSQKTFMYTVVCKLMHT